MKMMKIIKILKKMKKLKMNRNSIYFIKIKSINYFYLN